LLDGLEKNKTLNSLNHNDLSGSRIERSMALYKSYLMSFYLTTFSIAKIT